MIKTSEFIKKNYFFILFFIILFFMLLAFLTYRSYNNAKNINHVYLKIYTNGSTQSIRLFYSTNIGQMKEGNFEYDEKDKIWKIPNYYKKNIIAIQIEKTDNVKVDSVKYALTSKDYAKPEFLNYEKLDFLERNNRIELVISAKGSILPNYRHSVNWGGDFSLIFYPFLNSSAICLVLIFLFFLIKHRDYLKFKLQVKKTDIVFFLIISCLFIFLFYLNNRNNSLAVLSLRVEDEFIILPIFELFENPLAFLNSRLFYGVLNYLFVVPFVLFGIFTNSFEAVITGARMLSATAALLSLWVIYDLVKTTLSKINIFLIILFFISIPAFWLSATLIRPEWLMTVFLLLSIKFYLKQDENDNFNNRNNILSLLFFGIALAVKFHAIIFIPLYFLPYVMFWKRKSLLAITASLLFLLGAFITFKFELFFKGFDKEIEGLIFQAWNQKTGNSAGDNYKIVTIAQKLKMINSVFFPLWLFSSIFFSSLWMSIKLIKVNKTYLYLNITVLIILIYYALFVNKDWANYYLTPLIVMVLTWVLQLKNVFINNKTLTAVLLVGLMGNIIAHNDEYPKILADYHMPPTAVLNDLLEGNQFIIQNLSKSETINMLIDYGISKDFESYANVNVNWLTVQNGLEIQNNKLEWLDDFNYVILRKDKNVFSDEIYRRIITEITENGLILRFQNEVMAVYY